MNGYLLAFFLGVIEGVTEFLPVSSTAHLRIAQSLFGLDLTDSFWKMFAIVIQLGAVLCLPVYFRRRIVEFVKTFPSGKSGDRTALTHPLTLTIIASVVTLGPGYLLKKYISSNLENLTIIGGALAIGGAIMWSVDALCTSGKTQDMEQMSLPQSIWIGFCQIFSAVFPGTSRSMATIAAGQTAGMTRAAALEFSFFLSMPTMFVATGYDLLKTIRPGHDAANLAPLHVTGQQWVWVAIGFITSFFVAWAVVAWFMNWVRRRGFVPFAVYRIALGLVVLIWLVPR